MPSKKKKYNARFPAGRIKKIMQSDEEVGKVAQAVPVIISRTLELFVESLLKKTLKITNSRNAKTLSTSHMKQCIMAEQRFDFLRELVRNIPDISVAEEAANYLDEDNHSSPEEQYPDSDTPYDLSMATTSVKAGRSYPIASNGHNGGGIGQHQKNYLKRSISTNSSSVIRHTTSVGQTNVDSCVPTKLSRSDSSPIPHHVPTASSITTASVTQHQHPRLKHKSYSMPTHLVENHNNNNNKPNYANTVKQQTAIPAPIVNIDYCSKPVVKIDYSNLPMVEVTATNSGSTPMSAPANIANMSGNNTAFNFSSEPIINIDLSNIVASASATISIGTPLSTTISSTSFSPSSAVVDQQSRNSKEPLNSTNSSVTAKATALAAAVAAATTMTSVILTTKSDLYLDMDEDYDNI